MICSSWPVPRVAVTKAWVSPRVNNAEPCARGKRPTSTAIGRTSDVVRPSIRCLVSIMPRRTISCSTDLKMSPSVASTKPWSKLSSLVSASVTSVLTAETLTWRASLMVSVYASRSPASASSRTLAASSSKPSGTDGNSRGSLAQAWASSIIASITGWKALWPKETAPNMISSDSSEASDSTIRTPSRVPATTRSKTVLGISSSCGLRTYSPSIWPTRQPPIGPRNGRPEIVSAAEAPIRAAISGSFSWSCESTVKITWVSFLKPLTNSGRMGRSIKRDVRVSFSLGRASRLKKPPGILPAA